MNSQTGSRLISVKAAIDRMEARYQRIPGSVVLVAVSKTRTVEDILEASSHGQREFGESYVQEAVKKITSLTGEKLHWHFIGPIQKNKTRLIAQYFDWVHSIDRLIIARRLNTQRPALLPPLQVCIQVNIDNDTSKSGVPVDQLHGLAKSMLNLDRLKLRGLMAIPQASSDVGQQRQKFAQLRRQLKRLNRLGINPDTLSMGMSGDLEAAVAEGATIVRVGTAIFGRRAVRQHITCSHQ